MLWTTRDVRSPVVLEVSELVASLDILSSLVKQGITIGVRMADELLDIRVIGT